MIKTFAAFSAIFLAASTHVVAQVPRPSGATGVSKPNDVVFARRILMSGISRNMDEILGIIETPGDFDLPGAREHAYEISTMLLRVSFAKSEVWLTFDDFYDRAQGASQTALDASLAKRADQFRRLTLDLRQKCDACHAKYRRY